MVSYIPGGARFQPSTVAPENGWLEYYFPIGKVTFQGRAVKLREDTPWKIRHFEPKVVEVDGSDDFPDFNFR